MVNVFGALYHRRFLVYLLQAVYPLRKMALRDNSQQDMAIAGEHGRKISNSGVYDPEKNGYPGQQERKMSRIGPPPSANIQGVTSDSESDIVGKQMEMEAGNAIKYRTCTWQKVLRGALSYPVTAQCD